jgi:hypothetical protein
MLLTATAWAESPCTLYGIKDLNAPEQGPPASCSDAFMRIIKRAYMAVREFNDFNECIDANDGHLTSKCLEHHRLSKMAIQNLYYTDLIDYYGTHCKEDIGQ